jgi:cobalt/nickel transport system permease protein
VGVPELFVTQLLLVYRYSFLLAEEAGSIKKARDIRSFNGKGKDLFTTAKLIGSLLIRTTSRAEKIFMAMTARGFQSGLAKKTETPPFTKSDIASLVFSFLSFLAVRIVFIH